MKNIYEEFSKNNFLAYGSMFLAGAILITVSWGSKGSNIINTESTSDIIWSSLNFIFISYVLGFFVVVFVALIKDSFSVYLSIIAIPLFVFAFYTFTMSEYVSSERYAANQYKKLLEEHMITLDDETQRDLEYKIENIESERESWREVDDRDDY